MRLIRVSIRRKSLNGLFFEPRVELDGDYSKDGALLVDRATFDEWGHAEGEDVSEAQVETLIAMSRHRRAYSKALWLLSARDYTARGMMQKLMRDYGEDASKAAVERLCDNRLIDDERYAEYYAERMMADQNLSRRQVYNKLVQKGVPRHLAEAAVDAVEVSSDDQLDQWIEKRYGSKLASGDPDQIRKTVNALVRKGFNYSDVRAAIKRYCDAEFDD